MTKIKPGDAAAFRRLLNFLIKCQSLQYSNNQSPLDTPDVIYMILLKAPGFLQDRWNRHVHKIRKNQAREPGLLDLTNEINLVNDPLLSKEAVKKYEDKSLKPDNAKKIQIYPIKEKSGNQNRENSKYPICEGQHDIEDSTPILEQAVEDKSKTIYKNLVCYGFLEGISKEHNAKICSNRRKCKVCKGLHPTILHGIKIEKKKLKRGTDEVAATLATPKSQDEVKCTSINTGSNVTSMSKVPVKIKRGSGSKVICTYALLESCS